MTEENHSGARAMLKTPWVYRILQSIVGKGRALRHLRESIWRIEPGSKVIDIGCGPRPLLDSISSPIDYIGIDIDATYIASANARHGDRGRFLVGTTNDFMDDLRMSEADLILCNGVLHHLSDSEVIALTTFVEQHLKQNTGRFTAVEPCHLAFESRMSTWIMNQDRGRYVRSETEWKRLMEKNGNLLVQTRILTSMLRIPYHHIVLDCSIRTRNHRQT